MANAIKQFRFYSDSETEQHKNYPTTLTAEQLKEGTAFDEYYPIFQLGVQALPGTMLYLNGAENPVIIGQTGIYELDLEADTQIFNLAFDKISVDAISINTNAYLIVDIIYEEGED